MKESRKESGRAVSGRVFIVELAGKWPRIRAGQTSSERLTMVTIATVKFHGSFR